MISLGVRYLPKQSIIKAAMQHTMMSEEDYKVRMIEGNLANLEKMKEELEVSLERAKSFRDERAAHKSHEIEDSNDGGGKNDGEFLNFENPVHDK